MKKWSLLVVTMFFLTACSDEEAKPAETKEKEETAEVEQEQKEMTESGFITQVFDNKVLVNNIYFSIAGDVEVDSTNGSETTDAVVSDIRTGMKVDIDYTGPLKQGFPLEAEADNITILKDDESVKQAEALQAYINKEQLSSLLLVGQPIVRDNEIGFLFSNMDTGEMQEVRIDLDTHDYTVGNEEEEGNEDTN